MTFRKQRTEFILAGEPWECINCDIPMFRRIRNPEAPLRLRDHGLIY